MTDYRRLTEAEIGQLISQGCLANEWHRIEVAEPFEPYRLRHVHFLGDVRIGRLGRAVEVEGVTKTSSIFSASLCNVTIGHDCYIKHVGVHIANYDIGDRVAIVNTGLIVADPGATFGAGTEVEAVNEAGGRGVLLYPELSAQVAHLLAMHRYRPDLVARLEEMIHRRVETIRSDRGRIDDDVEILDVSEMRNVNVGTAARLVGPEFLKNGTVLSDAEAVTFIGSGVVARNFIIGERSIVTQGAILDTCFVGQGCKIGKQLSAENSLFFANCEAFHGECVSVLAGPYSVTHHKSTLLIAGHFSFYNAGSGSNMSNHMYKLGPVHQGILERGSKTGSFSYLIWPSRVGPFSVVIGKNMANFDLADLPFSYVEVKEGRSYVTPGFNLQTVGTVRDGAKWPVRDRRRGPVKRDLIHFQVFSPFTVGRMLRGEARLTKLAAETDRSVEEVAFEGALIRRLLLKRGAKYYRNAVNAWLAEQIMDRIDPVLDDGLDAARQRLKPDAAAAGAQEWVDLCGLLVARDRLASLVDDVEAGSIGDLEALADRLAALHAAYPRDEWNYVVAVWQERFGQALHEMDGEALAGVADLLLTTRGKDLRMILNDAGKEFAVTSRLGFGADGSPEDCDADFDAVRGTFETNSFVLDMQQKLAALEQRVEVFKTRVLAFGEKVPG